MNKARQTPSLTSPGSPGAFLFPNAAPFVRPAFVKRINQAGPVPPVCLPASPSPFLRRLAAWPAKAYAIAAPCRPAAALPLPAVRPCLAAGFPCPACRPAAGLVKPLPPACRRPRAAPEGRQPSAAGDPVPPPRRPPAEEWRFTNQR